MQPSFKKHVGGVEEWSKEAKLSNPTNKDEQPKHAGQKDGRSVSEVEAQERLGAGLKTMYRNVLNEPLPEDMLALLDQLDDADRSDGSGSPSDA